MKIGTRFALCLCLLVFFSACSSWSDQDKKELKGLQTQVQELRTQIKDLQGEINKLRVEQDAKLQELRTDLKHILHYMNLSLENLTRSGQEEEESLRDSARKTAEESVKKLLELSRKLLEKLEKDLEGNPDPGEEQETP